MSNDERITTDEAKQLIVLLSRFKRLCEAGVSQHRDKMGAVGEFSRAILSCNHLTMLATEWVEMSGKVTT